MVPKPGDEERTSIIPAAPRRLGADESADSPTADPLPQAAAEETSTSSAAVEHPCPHCGAEMVKHDVPEDSPKDGAWHCDACGGCWVHRGSSWYTRDGHPPPAGWAGE